MVNEIVLGAVEFVPEVPLAPLEFGGFNLGSWMANGIKDALLNVLNWAVSGIIDLSYWGCMIVGLTAIFLYLAGFKESKKYIAGSIIIYILLQILKVAIASVQ